MIVSENFRKKNYLSHKSMMVFTGIIVMLAF